MENKEIIRILRRTASLMEINGVNEFKVRAVNNAIFNLERIDQRLSDMQPEEIQGLNGIGKSIATQIAEIIAENESSELKRLLDQTPPGVRELLNIAGVGAKKIRLLWQQENINSPQALKSALDQGRLLSIKGFGKKIITQISASLEFYFTAKNHILLPEALRIHEEIENELKSLDLPRFQLTGEARRKDQVISEITYVIEDRNECATQLVKCDILSHDERQSSPYNWRGYHKATSFPVRFRYVAPELFPTELMRTTGKASHLASSGALKIINESKPKGSEEEIYKALDLPYIAPELRISGDLDPARIDKLITLADVKGILHAHSTYSDGQHSLREMIEGCIARNYTYLGITDHSKSSFFYANGLFENRVIEQFAEIEQLRTEYPKFALFKGIECDILSDGALDYASDILEQFDFVIISVHSVLNMDIKTATARLIRAIENPYSTILGHLSGRLLLRREGYPLHMPSILDACKANDVTIEINANPRRLDIDWHFLNQVLEKNIRISINPDAHSIHGIDDVKYGVWSARKGMVTPENNLTSFSAPQLEEFFRNRKKSKKATNA